MDEYRVKRYRDKLNIILLRTEQIKNWTENINNFMKDEKTKLAVYKAFQEIVESAMDIISMMCVDSKLAPKDDYSNIEEISKRIDGINEEILKEANGLRNVIIHRYNGLDDARAYEGIKKIIPEMEKFVEIVEIWMKKKI
ncbi:MAG: DUF86 domain-containing protein [Thermoplasmata archaeon]|nr:DUF86 domain-containing protein [Thermoplasmata archaeon]